MEGRVGGKGAAQIHYGWELDALEVPASPWPGGLEAAPIRGYPLGPSRHGATAVVQVEEQEELQVEEQAELQVEDEVGEPSEVQAEEQAKLQVEVEEEQ